MKLRQTAVLLAGLVALQAVAEDKKAPATQPSLPSAPQAPAAPSKEKVSYAVGMKIAGNLKQQEADVDVETIAKAMKDVFSGGATQMTDRECAETIRSWQMGLQQKFQEGEKAKAEKNQKDGEEFLAKKAKEPGVKVLPSGLAYKVIKEGNGPTPKATDIVSANYRGTLVDGTEFDSSYSRNQPLEIGVNQVIAGWTEALQLMPVGSKWELYIPYKLAYGERRQGPKIGPKSALVFEMELLSIKAPAKAATNEVVSGEIIKVPSADEMKKGAKIEVIKAGATNTIDVKK